VAFAPALPLEPFAGDCLEGAQVRDSLRLFGSLALGAGVDAVGEKAPGLVPFLPGAFQRNLGINAEGQNLLRLPRLPVGSAAESVLEPPPLFTRRYSPFSSKSFRSLASGLALST
jgi:hypothetical protein